VRIPKILVIVFSILLLLSSNILAQEEVKERIKLFYPTRAFSDNQRLYVVDSFNHRVLIYDTLEPIEQQTPSVVVGQPDLQATTMNSGGLGPQSLLVPESAYSDGKVFIIADTGNHRVLIFNNIPTRNFAKADVVLGQPDFDSNVLNKGDLSGRSLYFPKDVFFDGKNLYTSDTYNNRVLIYHGLPRRNFAYADVVLGQPDFKSNRLNCGGPSASSLAFPSGIFSSSDKLFIVDQMNHRVKIYNSIPAENNAPCDVIIGQKNSTDVEPNAGKLRAEDWTLNNPTGVFYDGQNIYVVDFGNNRILVFDSIPTENGQPADTILGQVPLEAIGY
jgi:hypothetical protein